MPEIYSLDRQEKFSFDAYLKSRRERVEERLSHYLSEGRPEKLWEAMRYSVLSGGKRLRAMLALAAAESVARANSLQVDPVEVALPLACAIEMVHAMSLIHDDLPCLDNDDLRRGKPTNHKVFGEAMALLAGDGLLMLANEVLLTHSHSIVSKDDLLAVSLGLSRATGPSGMVGGQVLDMEFTGHGEKGVSLTTLEEIHSGKTGALIRFSLWSGGKLLGGSPEQLESLSRLGDIMGLAFQITDDLLDVVGDAKTLGKTPGKDQATSKATWISAFGIDGAREKLQTMEAEGETLIKRASLDNQSSPVLSHLLKYSIHRNK